MIKALDDGSYLSVIYPSTKSRRSRAGEITVRVIEYALPGVPDAHARYRLLSTLLDPTQAPALELAALYHERWEVEAVFDELKMHLVQRRRTLRSKTPMECVRSSMAGCWRTMRCVGSCTKPPARIAYSYEVCPSPVMCICYAAPSSDPGPFPPARPPIAATLVRRPAARGSYTAKHE